MARLLSRAWLIPALLASQAVQAQTVYGVDAHSDALSIVDLDRGTSRIVGPLDRKRSSASARNRFAAPVALAVRPSDGQIFVWNNGGVDARGKGTHDNAQGLLKVDARTGAAVLVGGHGTAGAMAFGPDGRLYRFDRDLAVIDPETGAETAVGPLHAPRGAGVSVDGAAYDEATGTMYVTGYPGPTSDPGAVFRYQHSLYAANLDTGELRRLGSVAAPPGMMVGDLVMVPGQGLFGTAFSPSSNLVFRVDMNLWRTVIVAESSGMTGVQGMGVAGIASAAPHAH